MVVEIVKAKPQAPSKFLIIGEPFSGKTTLAGKAPAPLFVSTDGNAAKSGYDAINIVSVADIRDSITLFKEKKEYKTLVIDTLEGVIDIFSKAIVDEFNQMGAKTSDGNKIQSLQDVPFGRATGVLNKRVQGLADTLAKLDKNVIILSYSKRQVDDVTDSIVLSSEFKNIRLITRFMDAEILTFTDGEKHDARIIEKREIAHGDVDFGEIEGFLAAIGWSLPKKSVKLGKAQGKK